MTDKPKLTIRSVRFAPIGYRPIWRWHWSCSCGAKARTGQGRQAIAAEYGRGHYDRVHRDRSQSIIPTTLWHRLLGTVHTVTLAHERYPGGESYRWQCTCSPAWPKKSSMWRHTQAQAIEDAARHCKRRDDSLDLPQTPPQGP